MTKWLVVFQEPYQPDQWTWCATKELAEAEADSIKKKNSGGWDAGEWNLCVFEVGDALVMGDNGLEPLQFTENKP
jgi:hypothetical protein